MTRRIVSLIAAFSMMLSVVGLLSVPAAAAQEGIWTTYRSASEYPKEGEEPNPEKVYKPEAGYTYTSEGFSVIPADYKDTTPFLTVQTKEAQDLKDGIYMQVRIDEYSYNGGIGADQWIAFSLNSKPKVAIGNTKHGGGWADCMRGSGDGIADCAPCITVPDDGDVAGYFTPVGAHALNVPLDDKGREIYTLEVKWTGSSYEIRINGAIVPGNDDATYILETLDPNGRFYVGITLYSMVKSGTAGVTVLKYGTSEADAVTPTGSDSKQPEENLLSYADIIDPDTVETNMPAILWSPETTNMGSGYNCAFTPQGDNTWRLTASDAAIFFNFSPKREWSYEGSDFPVFGIMMRDIGDLSVGSLWYAAGEYMGAQNDHVIGFDIYDGEFYVSDRGEYVFVTSDLSALWDGRINSIRLDFSVYDGAEFFICFAGMFRSDDEAYAYAENYLNENGIIAEETEDGTALETEPETVGTDINGDDTRQDETVAEAVTDESVNSEISTDVLATNGPADEDTADASAKADTATATETGCASVIGIFTVLLVLAPVAAFAAVRKKRD